MWGGQSCPQPAFSRLWRVRDTKVEIPAPRLEPADCSTFVFSALSRLAERPEVRVR
jgi:flagella basal body P-ring formation protein FlgA